MPSKKVRFQDNAWDERSNGDKADSMVATHLDYFTCTLGEAAQWNDAHPHPFETVNHLVDAQADELRQRPAVNFPGGCNGANGRAIKSGRPENKDQI